jgi:hypothetical protein
MQINKSIDNSNDVKVDDMFKSQRVSCFLNLSQLEYEDQNNQSPKEVSSVSEMPPTSNQEEPGNLGSV